MTGLYILALVPLFAVLNRGAGRDQWFPGRNIYGIILAAFALIYLLFDVYLAAAVALSWATYRLPGWYDLLDMGRNNEGYWDKPWNNVCSDFIMMIPRQLFYFPVFAYAHYYQDVPLTDAVTLWITTGVMGALGYLSGHIAWQRSLNDPLKPLEAINPGVVAELVAGAGLGLGTALIILQIY